MLDGDDWRTLSGLFASYQNHIMGNQFYSVTTMTEPRAELAAWLRDRDTPLLEIDNAVWRDLAEVAQLQTPGRLVAGNLAWRACAFEFDHDSGLLRRGRIVWGLERVTGVVGGGLQLATLSRAEGGHLWLLAERGPAGATLAVRRTPSAASSFPNGNDTSNTFHPLNNGL